MKKANPDYKINELCRIFNLKSSTHYYHLNNEISEPKQEMMEKIKEIAIEHQHTYGKRRIQKELSKQGYSIGVHQTSTLMKQANVIAIRPKKKHRYDKGEQHPIAENLLKRQFNPTTLNSHWVGDITYIKNHTGWSYLACVLDLGSREIVGWSLSKSPDAALAKAALQHAIAKQNPNTEYLHSMLKFLILRKY